MRLLISVLALVPHVVMPFQAVPLAGSQTKMWSTPPGFPGGPVTPEQMKMAADAMKNLDKDQIEMMLKQMESLTPEQKEEMKKAGTNPEILKVSLRLLKSNPAALDMMKKQMNSLTPEQMAKASEAAQKQMESMTSEDLEKMEDMYKAADFSAAPSTIDVTPDAMSARDTKLIDALFTTGEYCTSPPSGGVDMRTFKTLPPIAMLMGDLPDDLSDDDISQVWAEQAGTLNRLDRAAFERVWLAIDDIYGDDLMTEARRPPKKTRAVEE